MVTEYRGSSLTADKILCPEACFLFSSYLTVSQEEHPFQQAHQINIARVLCTKFVEIYDTVLCKDLITVRETVTESGVSISRPSSCSNQSGLVVNETGT